MRQKKTRRGNSCDVARPPRKRGRGKKFFPLPSLPSSIRSQEKRARKVRNAAMIPGILFFSELFFFLRFSSLSPTEIIFSERGVFSNYAERGEGRRGHRHSSSLPLHSVSRFFFEPSLPPPHTSSFYFFFFFCVCPPPPPLPSRATQ